MIGAIVNGLAPVITDSGCAQMIENGTQMHKVALSLVHSAA